MRYAVKLSYNGADFHGWQIQPDAPSVQQVLQDSLSTLLRTGIEVTGAGRTDSGVNAMGYVAHFDAPEGLDTNDFRYKLNAILPKSVTIHGIVPVADDFHARFDATRREYTYFLHSVKDPFTSNFSLWYPYPLDFGAMNCAAALLTGTHDFKCFEKTGGGNKTSTCTVFEAGWHGYTPSHLAVTGQAGTEGYYYFRIAADRFLRNMVRAVVGTLLDVGRGRRDAGSLRNLLESGTRCDAGESVPGNALFLSGVDY